MAILRSEFYQSGVALLLWFQKLEMSVATKYDIDPSDMKYIASSLSSQECYDFYHLLSHRRAIRDEISIYAEKERAQEISCISLLATWMTDPAESAFRSNENIELKLRAIGRKDLALWILKKMMNSSLKRRELSPDEINQQIEETELHNAIVRNRSGERIIPMPSVEDQTFLKNNYATEDRQTSCVFWKVFFSCLIVLLIVVLVLCFYRFVYTKLRCICRRFGDAEDLDHCLPEQTYGTACSSTRKKIWRKRRGDNAQRDHGSDEHKGGFELSERFSSSTETNDEILSSVTEEKRSLLPNNANELTDIRAAIDHRFLSNSRNPKSMEFPLESREIMEKPTKFPGSRSERVLSRSKKINELSSGEKKSPRWISCSCNLMEKSLRTISATSKEKKIDRCSSGEKNDKTIISSRESLSELSETYDELGMLFSQYLKLQWKPCDRKYCAITRKLRRGKVRQHDVKKCRGRKIFGDKMMIGWDERPACSSGNICRDTYDEFRIMRSTREERGILARSIIERRKSFLDQPCLSPIFDDNRGN